MENINWLTLLLLLLMLELKKAFTTCCLQLTAWQQLESSFSQFVTRSVWALTLANRYIFPAWEYVFGEIADQYIISICVVSQNHYLVIFQTNTFKRVLY